ncbi:Oidioi.mRNA.OKI2018_I69.chr2.g4458.t1.cds [Oikopleura dioica]|uniref:Oidioi.mRNA.OKI2018_I69.chr2.g4458.t1.cds n=1 Tax=Oikopleura dioica TaxID=34765 RepID=A0ABN7SXU1_OIKDI|nr:Oidioi.mRNA.OKI2018_I69.chr2.g4458.t1.cds [Oikopleura dioica]
MAVFGKNVDWLVKKGAKGIDAAVETGERAVKTVGETFSTGVQYSKDKLAEGSKAISEVGSQTVEDAKNTIIGTNGAIKNGMEQGIIFTNGVVSEGVAKIKTKGQETIDYISSWYSQFFG